MGEDTRPFLTTREAAMYCGFKTAAGLRKAKLQGRVKAAGRRGGVGSLMWRRSDLDDFLRGVPIGAATLARSAGTPQMRELLFPSETGGFRAASCLDRPFEVVCKELGLKKRITSRGMRRTFNDLCRKAQVESVVTRSISGHATEQMKQHYETVNVEEKRINLASSRWRGSARPSSATVGVLGTATVTRCSNGQRPMAETKAPRWWGHRGAHWGAPEGASEVTLVGRTGFGPVTSTV
jgi:hypothetical protein